MSLTTKLFLGSLRVSRAIKKLMYFIFPNLGLLKYTRFCKVREKKLMYFIFPNLGPLKYIKCEKMTSSTKVH